MGLRLRFGWACGADVARFFATCLVGSSCAAELHLGLPGPLLREEVVSCPAWLHAVPSELPPRADGLSVALVALCYLHTSHRGCQGLVLRGDVNVRIALGAISFRVGVA